LSVYKRSRAFSANMALYFRKVAAITMRKAAPPTATSRVLYEPNLTVLSSWNSETM